MVLMSRIAPLTLKWTQRLTWSWKLHFKRQQQDRLCKQTQSRDQVQSYRLRNLLFTTSQSITESKLAPSRQFKSSTHRLRHLKQLARNDNQIEKGQGMPIVAHTKRVRQASRSLRASMALKISIRKLTRQQLSRHPLMTWRLWQWRWLIRSDLGADRCLKRQKMLTALQGWRILHSLLFTKTRGRR